MFQKPKTPIKPVVQQPPQIAAQPSVAAINVRPIETRYIDFGFKGIKDVVQCYHCGTMLPRNEMFAHMENNHGKFYSHMCGPPRPYQCSFCKRTMETEKQQSAHR